MAVIEQRYAHVLADLVDSGAVAAATLRSDLRDVCAMMASSPALGAVLTSPAVGWEDKSKLLDQLASSSGLARLTRNFLLVAAERGRMTLLPAIERAFEQLLLDRQGIVRAEVASARSLSEAERAALEAELGRRLGVKLQAHYHTDRELVGGFIARVGDQVYDGSLRGRLDRLRQTLMDA
ncbi:MAG: ATP synthase F1 subunit delta [Terriglobales bacterium]